MGRHVLTSFEQIAEVPEDRSGIPENNLESTTASIPKVTSRGVRVSNNKIQFKPKGVRVKDCKPGRCTKQKPKEGCKDCAGTGVATDWKVK